MSMTLTSGRESRMEGAPPLPDPEKEARVRAVAIHLLEQIGEPVTEESLRAIMPDAERMAEQYSTPQFEAAAIEANRAGMDAAVARGDANAANRASQRQSARGVVPEDLPADEYGSVSARTVRDANMSPEDQEASLNQFQGLVDGEIKDLREGRFHGANAQARQYEQDYGLPTNPSKTGKTDLDYLREIQRHQGFLRTGRGEMIPIGPAPTPEAIASRRDFDEWRNETPGSVRQATYDPQGYETFREGVRQDIQDDARQNMADYGTGPSSPNVREDLGLPPLTPKQLDGRGRRARSEDRVAEAEREARIARLARRAGVSRAEARAKMDAQRDAMRPDGQPMTPLDVGERRRESQELRDLAGDRRDADLAARRERASMNARLSGGQPTAGSRAAVQNMMQGRDRFDELIARLGQENMTDWQRAGIIAGLTPNAETANPTPLGVQAVGAGNAFQVIRGMGLGEGLLTNPAVAHQIENAQMQQQAAILEDAEKYVNDEFAWDKGWLGASDYSVAEQQQTLDYLLTKYRGRLTQQQAQQIVDLIASRKMTTAGDTTEPAPTQPTNPGLPPPGSFAPPL